MTSITIDRKDGLSSSTAVKGPCRVATTANVTLYGLQTIDGVAIASGDRILVLVQTAGYENGIYVADTGQWRRAKDFSRNNDVMEGTLVVVAEGTTYSRSLWGVTTANPIVIGTTTVVLQQIIVSAAVLAGLEAAALAAATAAAASAAAAAAAAASLNLPALGTGNKGKGVTVNAAETGYEFNLLPIVVPTRTALKALTVLISRPVLLTEAGREGTFVLQAGSPPVSDTQEGIYVVSNTASFYWKRSFDRTPSVRVFGAVLDGSTDDTNAIAGSLAVLGSAFVPYTATGFVAGGITLDTAQSIIGERKPIWKTRVADTYAVRCTAYMSAGGTALNEYAYLEGFVFDMAASTTTTASAILMGTSTRIVYGLRVRNCDAKNCFSFYLEETHATNYVVDVSVTDCTCTLTKARQVYSKRSRGFFTFRDFKIDHSQNAAQVTWEGARFEDMVGLELEKFDVLGPIDALVPTHIYQAASIGLVIAGASGSASIWLTRVLVDNTRGPGIIISNVAGVYGSFVEVYANLGNGIDLQTVTKSIFTNTRAVGAIGISGAAAGAIGINMQSCVDVLFDAHEIDSFTGSGNLMISCQDCKMTNGHSKSNTNYGYGEVTAATRNLRLGVTSAGNGVGSLLQIGAQSATANWYSNAGTYTASTAGAATV